MNHKITEMIPEDTPKFMWEVMNEGQLFNKMKTAEFAINTLKEVFKNEPDYAHVWHCNIAMACFDAMPKIGSKAWQEQRYKEQLEMANEGASRFMKLCFDVVTSQEPEVPNYEK